MGELNSSEWAMRSFLAPSRFGASRVALSEQSHPQRNQGAFMMKTRTAAFAAAITLAGAAALAAVAFDPASGTGFVGKGDIQLAFGWNNDQLQRNAALVGFNYRQRASYSATCEFITGEGTRGQQTHDVAVTKMTMVNDQVLFDTRTHKQIDGFNLTGLGSSTIVGAVPEVGGTCPDGPNGGTWVSVTQTGSFGGLFTSYSGNSVLIWGNS
jgi:hypothetical protein